MKHKLISCISVLLVVLIIFGTGAFSAATLETSTEVSSKISPDLQTKLSEMSDDDTVEVAVWLNNTDEETLENAYKNELQKSINRGIITTDIATATALFDESSNLETEPLSIEKTQQLLSIRRSSYNCVITTNNTNWQEDIKPLLSNDANIVYFTTCAPVVIMEVTKADIEKLEHNEVVESIYFYSLEEEPVEVSVAAEASSDYQTWQKVTNIQTLRDIMGYTGAGIKIGMLENNLPYCEEDDDIFVECLVNQNNKINFTNDDGKDTHATYVASIILGKTSSYSGVAPNATLYCGGNAVGYITSINNLVNKGINILTISLGLGAGSHNFNYYGFYAKFLDYISYQYCITVCICAGNHHVASEEPDTGLPEGVMSYNAITVGNVALTGEYPDVITELHSSSSYLIDDTQAYKPDLCAPGHGVVTPCGTAGYTSAATPVIAGVCALLMEADSRLVGRPTLVKSILMSSTERLPIMGEEYSSNSPTPALVYGYGAGMVDAYDAYNLLNSNNWRCIEISSALESDQPYTMDIPVSQADINTGKKYKISLNWLQKNSLTDNTGNTNVYVVTRYSLSVNNPNGTRVAYSFYQYDNKQYIYFKPTVVGTYKIVVQKQAITNYKTPLTFSYYKTS